MTGNYTKWFCWLPVIALCMAIFLESCFPSPDVGLSFPLKDKVLHMAAFGLLAVLFARAGRMTWPGSLSSAQLLIISVCFATLFGASDELHQAFVVTRRADLYDFLADLAGSVLGVTAYLMLTPALQKYEAS